MYLLTYLLTDTAVMLLCLSAWFTKRFQITRSTCCMFQLYGPGAVFYKLSTACVETIAGKYTYSVCPFGPIKQTEHGRLSVVIGSQAKWLDRGPSIYRLLLDAGDSTNCPAAQHRWTTVCILACVNNFNE